MADGGMVEKLTQAELLNQNFKEAKETIVEIHKRVKLKSGNELLLLKKENGWGIAEYNPKSKKELDWFPFADKETANYWLDKVDVDKYASGGYMADGGKTTVVDDFGSMSFRNQYDEWEMVVVSKELEKDGGRFHKDRFLVSAKDIDEAKKIATELWKKEFGDSDLSIVKVMSDSLYKLKYIDTYAEGGMTPLDVSNQIYDITVRIAELGDINTEAAYEETKNLMKMRAALQARALHLQDMEMAKGGYMADGGIIYLESVGTYFRPSDLATSSEESFSNEGEIVDLADIDNEEWWDALSEEDRATIEKYKAKGGYMAHGGKLEVGDEGMYEGGEAVILTIDDKSYGYSYLDEDGKPKSQKLFAAKSKFENQFRVFPKYAGGGQVKDSSILQALNGYNSGLTISGIAENLGLSNYRFGKYASESQMNSIETEVKSLVESGYVEEGGVGYKITEKGARYLDSIPYQKRAKGGYMADGGELHRSQEKYAYGRYMAMGGAIEHGLKKGDHIMVVRGNMLGIKNEITGEIVTLNIETGERKESKE